jgi:hypothetical protein
MEELSGAGRKLEGRTQPSLVIGSSNSGIKPETYIAEFFSH